MKRTINLLLFTIVSFCFAITLNAKNGTIKFGKNIIYEGNVEDKIPLGEGVLKLYDPLKKGDFVLSISGEFDNNIIKEASINSLFFPNITIQGDVSFDCEGSKGKALTLNISFPSNIIKCDQLYSHRGNKINEIRTGNLWMKFSQIDPKANWAFNYGQKEADSFYAFYADKVPQELVKLHYSDSNIKRFYGLFRISSENNRIFSKDYPLVELTDSSSFSADKLYYKDGKVVSLKAKTWEGSKKLKNGIIVELKNGVFTLNFSENHKYVGTLKNEIFYPLYADLDNPQFEFYSGIETQNGQKTEWINGESFEQRHERLKSVLRDKWVNLVESNELTEDQALAKQKEEDESIRVAEERAAILKSRWGGRQVLFEGKAIIPQEANAMFRTMFNLDNSYIEATACLVLDDTGQGNFALLTEPSQKAWGEGRGKLLQVNSFCQDFNRKYKKEGTWTIEGNKILLNNEETNLTIGKDGKTISYEKLFYSTMKISMVKQESAVQ